jgi:hypothetical protein
MGRRSKGESDTAFLVGRNVLLARERLAFVTREVGEELDGAGRAAFSGPPMKSIPSPSTEKIELRGIRLPVEVPPSITIPSWPLKAMVFPSPEAVAPMKLPGA